MLRGRMRAPGVRSLAHSKQLGQPGQAGHCTEMNDGSEWRGDARYGILEFCDRNADQSLSLSRSKCARLPLASRDVLQMQGADSGVSAPRGRARKQEAEKILVLRATNGYGRPVGFAIIALRYPI